MEVRPTDSSMLFSSPEDRLVEARRRRRESEKQSKARPMRLCPKHQRSVEPFSLICYACFVEKLAEGSFHP